MRQFEDYSSYVSSEAQSLFEEHEAELKDELKNDTVDVYDFFDQTIHEWVDSDFIGVDLYDCADILEQSNSVEDDSGLWEGQEPMEAIQTQAFFTYRTDLTDDVQEAVSDFLDELEDNVEFEMKEKNEEIEELEEELRELDADSDEYEDKEEERDEVQDEYDDLETYLDNIQDTKNLYL